MSFLSATRRLLVVYLVLTGLAAHAAVALGLVLALRHYQLTPVQALVRASQKIGIDAPWLTELLRPGPLFPDHVLDGRVREAHPRILLPALATWDGRGQPSLMAEREAGYARAGIPLPPTCPNAGGLLGAVACWVTTGHAESARYALEQLRGFQVHTPSATGQYSNVWALALAYDLLARHPDLSAEDRRQVAAKIAGSVRDHLVLLDGGGPSLWHGRASLATAAWLGALVLPPGADRDALLARAQSHFLDVMRALEITGAWPEGYNYWVNNRAVLLGLGAAGYLNGLEGAAQADRVREAVHQAALWPVHAVRADHRVEGLGDEGPRVDLKDESRQFIDLAAQLTRDPVLASFSRYIGRLHGAQSYYRDYRWEFRLFNDPSVPPAAGVAPGELAGLGGHLPGAKLFGRRGLNLAFIRAGWRPEDTLITFRAGHTFTHHGHYDAGHFSLFKGAPLAVNSSTYGDFTGPNRLDYSIRTVAKNSLLVLRPGERVQPHPKFFATNVADGGQRVVIPTGSAVESVAEWEENIGAGLHLEGGQITEFAELEDELVYVAADLTDAYNNPAFDAGGSGGKVRRVRRALLYLRGDDRLLVHDLVESTDPRFVKKWLLHTLDRPQVDGARVLAGTAENGILESAAATALVGHDRARLRVERVLPRDAVMRLVGGPDYRFYVESDGDDADLDGVNQAGGANLNPWFDQAFWRIEIQPGAPRARDEFLVALTPRLGTAPAAAVAEVPLGGDGAVAVTAGATLVVLTRAEAGGQVTLTPPPGVGTLYLAGLPRAAAPRVRIASAELDGRGTGPVRAYTLPVGAPRPLAVDW